MDCDEDALYDIIQDGVTIEQVNERDRSGRVGCIGRREGGWQGRGRRGEGGREGEEGMGWGVDGGDALYDIIQDGVTIEQVNKRDRSGRMSIGGEGGRKGEGRESFYDIIKDGVQIERFHI